jgi:protein-disulfide isomerase-like protein with CxxC motif
MRLPGALSVIYTYGLPLGKVIQSGARIFDAETYISTQQAQALEEARVPDSHEDEERGRSAVAPPGQRAQARIRGAGFPRLVFPQHTTKAVIITNSCAGF